MKFYPPEPLTPEERELAQLTAQLGPQGEPSTALDARILAAAHAALDRKQPSRRRPRWPVAMGLAASVIFAVGIAWQLRPLQQTPVPVSAEAPMPAAAAEQEAMADSAASAPSSPSLPEATIADNAADKAAAAAPAPAYEEAAQAPPPPPPVKNLAPPSQQQVDQPRQTVRSATRAYEPSRRRAQDAGNVGAGVPPPPAPPAPAAMAAAPAPAAEPSVSFAPDPDAYSARGAAADSAAPTAGLLAAKPQAEALAEAKVARANASARQKESASLDRIEVTGSRLKRTDLQVPVSDDAQLPVNEWLERVRTRYGLGDAGAAKQSLLLFVKDHPSEPVPGDLEPLLEE